jgi:hypothetical protein
MTSDQVWRMRRQDGSGEAGKTPGGAPGKACEGGCRPSPAEMCGGGEKA